MAKIWAVYEGNEPTIGGPWAHLPVSEAVALFELRPDDYVSGLKPTPRFGDVNRDLIYAEFKHIVVEIKRNEGRQANWKPGFYKSRIKPKDAVVRLIRQALVAELGDDNVVRAYSDHRIRDRSGAGLGWRSSILTTCLTKQKGLQRRRLVAEHPGKPILDEPYRAPTTEYSTLF